MKKLLTIFLILMAFLTGSKASTTWIGPSGGTWYDNANWSSGDPFNGNDGNAIFNGFNGIINMTNTNAAVRSLNITGNSNVVFQNSSSTGSFSGLYLQSYIFFPHTVSNIEAGSILTMSQTDPASSAQMNMILKFGDELNVYGSLIFTGNSPLCASSLQIEDMARVKIHGLLRYNENTGNTRFSNYSTCEFHVMAGGVYESHKNGGIIPGSYPNQPMVFYDPASTIKLTGVTTTFPTFNEYSNPLGNLYCGNLLYDSPGQSATVNANLSNNFLVKGKLTVANTNSQVLQLGTTLTTLTVNGNMDIGPSGGTGQVVLGNSASASTATVLGNTLIGTGWKLDLQSSSGGTTLNQKGGLTNNGELTESGSGTADKVIFNGSSGDQSLSGSGIFTNTIGVEVNKSGGNVVLASNVAMPYILTLTNGRVALGQYNLSVGGILPASVISEASYIVTDGAGMLDLPVNGTVEFPIGPTTAVYAPAKLEAPNANFSVRASQPLTAPDGANYVGVEWEISPTLNGIPANIFLQWPTSEQLGAFDPSLCHVSHYNGNDWEQITTDGAATAGTIANSYTTFANGVTDFSPFAVGGPGNLLPLELLSFQGKEVQKLNLLEWTTAQEDNVRSFEIERSATGNGNWISIGELPSTGSITSTNQYRFEDAAPLNIGYYKLKIKDFDGKEVFSDIILIKRSDAALNINSISPNPFTENVVVEFYTSNEEPAVIRMTNTAGITVFETTLNFNNVGLHTLDLPLGNLPSGVYFMELTNDHEKAVKRIVKE
jgi:hypothetical protein